MDTINSRETINYVMGYAKIGGGYAVMSPDKTVRLTVDHNNPITLQRCAEIMQAAREMSGRDLYKISIRLSVYSKTPGNECGDWAETCYMDKHWDYDSRTNSLVIYDKGEPVYANDNGVICRDAAALHDSLF